MSLFERSEKAKMEQCWMEGDIWRRSEPEQFSRASDSMSAKQSTLLATMERWSKNLERGRGRDSKESCPGRHGGN